MGMPHRFGMFVHWGLYSLTGYHEQVRWRFFTPRDEYRKLIDKFNPVKFDPDEWVSLAKNAGMEYICITTKHHDGFCMFDTKYIDFNIMNTPYRRDILKELSEACERGGIALSLYYSNPDWNCPFAYNSKSSHQFPSKGDIEDTEKYREFVKNQLRELLTNYGKIYTFFWDIPTNISDPSMNEFIRSLQPDILINDRGWGDIGDFSTPERSVPEGGKFERFTEACQSVGKQSWGYRADEDYYTARFLIQSIDKIFVKDGSYLLNVGPMPDGRIPEPAAALVRRVGDWYNRVREAFSAEPCAILNDKNLLTTKYNDTLYVHIPDGLNSCGLTLKPLDVLPKSVTLLNDGRPLKYAITTMPEDKDWSTQLLRRPSLHIFNIPADEFSNETMILKIELDNEPIKLN
jgi:alpha-L-fucosidase